MSYRTSDAPSAALNPTGIYADVETTPRILKTPAHKSKIGRHTAVKALQNGEQMLYAMRLRDGLIKIGCTGNLAQRATQLGGDIIAFAFGDFDDEAGIHEHLAAHVHHGREWYHPTPQVMAVVNNMRRQFNLEPLAA